MMLVVALGWMDIYRRGQRAEAVEHLKRGVAHYNSKEYDAAIMNNPALPRLAQAMSEEVLAKSTA